MWLTHCRLVMLLSSRVGGMTVKDLVAQECCSKYRARLIVREMEQDGIIIRRGNAYHYNHDNMLAAVAININNEAKSDGARRMRAL